MHEGAFCGTEKLLCLDQVVTKAVCACMLICFCPVQLFETPCTVAHQTPLSMGFSKQEYCSGLPCPPPGDLPDPGIKSASLASPALAGSFFTANANLEAHKGAYIYLKIYIRK